MTPYARMSTIVISGHYPQHLPNFLKKLSHIFPTQSDLNIQTSDQTHLVLTSPNQIKYFRYFFPSPSPGLKEYITLFYSEFHHPIKRPTQKSIISPLRQHIYRHLSRIFFHFTKFSSVIFLLYTISFCQGKSLESHHVLFSLFHPI